MRAGNFLAWCIAAGALGIALNGCGAPAPPPEKGEAAIAAAAAWLALVDGGDYEASWSTAAQIFRGAVDAGQWAAQARAARVPLGAVTDRVLARTEYHTRLPGAPDGEYVVITYHTAFTNKAAAVETITPMRDPDGEWRVSGYFVR